MKDDFGKLITGIILMPLLILYWAWGVHYVMNVAFPEHLILWGLQYKHFVALMALKVLLLAKAAKSSDDAKGHAVWLWVLVPVLSVFTCWLVF